ncbi:ABC transporter ATP-binding protein [Agrobacterium arsenijevicii]|uniref:ABC transporter ATP-binding protein n=1 Tax=Agrobacterium arsenijevicii TaxID=1585697 RepID=UPI0009E30409
MLKPAVSSATLRVTLPDHAVVLQNVVKSYDGTTQVVKGVDLAVHAGEFLTILGPSGSGKTSLLMMLAGFEQPSAGAIIIGGRDVSRQPAHQRNIGMVFQQYALFPHLTVAQNLAFPLEMRRLGRREINDRVGWALNLVKLDGLGARRPAQLSGGQQQRIAVARALIFEPQLVLMDEPLGALDKQLRQQMQDEIARLHHELRPTIIYVTHDQGEAISLSDRVAVFEGGKISQIDPPTELYNAPRNDFVAGFIGENNRIPARVISHGPPTRLAVSERAIVSAINIDIGPTETDACLMVRPERLRRIAERTALPNAIDAVVIEISYHGDSYRLRAGLGTGVEVISRIPNDGTQSIPDIGETILLGWSTEDARAFAGGVTSTTR